MTAPAMPPIPVFRFWLEIAPASADDKGPTWSQAAFSECTGLEATMEPKVIKEGGRNYGAVQRIGPVTFGTVVLKRGLTRDARLWEWFAASARQLPALRRNVTIEIRSPSMAETGAVQRWTLVRALPIKLKVPDLSARATEVGIEELHLAHEGMLPG
jgi:phage tail-like protein